MHTALRCASFLKLPLFSLQETISWCWVIRWRKWRGWWVKSTVAVTTAASIPLLVGPWRIQVPYPVTRRSHTLPTQFITPCSRRRCPLPVLSPHPASRQWTRSDPIMDSSKPRLRARGRSAAASSTGAQGCPVLAVCARCPLHTYRALMPWACPDWRPTQNDLKSHCKATGARANFLADILLYRYHWCVSVYFNTLIERSVVKWL